MSLTSVDVRVSASLLREFQKQRLRVLFVQPSLQPSLQPPGGSKGHGVWMVRARPGTHDITVCSWQPVELPSVHAHYCTALDPRHAKRPVASFEVVICGHNETDFGAKTLQYIHYPSRLRPRPEVDRRWCHRAFGGLRAYYALCDWAADFRPEQVVKTKTIANSSLVAERMVQPYGE